ncbi:hypothetical protein [Embleya sp. NBC_00896]|uniref:hypothetical protein n=1 Tax=Embleya sp. NBC_00896 TaxID=2975961 RepID=UPI002F914F9D|nr:hypothetical protein OG928_37220 [Embleya sp. NBC_00896]
MTDTPVAIVTGGGTGIGAATAGDNGATLTVDGGATVVDVGTTAYDYRIEPRSEETATEPAR